jgi:hypothetical protein
VFTVSTIREQIGKAGRVVQVVQRQPGWVMRLALLAGVLTLGAIAALLIIPALIIMLAVFVLGAALAALRSLFVRAQRPNGMLDGRRNVRVIQRDDARV